MDLDNREFAQKLREGTVIMDGVVRMSTQVWDMILERLENSEVGTPKESAS